MSEYGDYTERIFGDSIHHQILDHDEISGEFIDFNPHETFGYFKVSNSEFQAKYLQEKNTMKDTDCTVHESYQKIQNSADFQGPSVIQTQQHRQFLCLLTKKGLPDETMQLNTNFKTIFLKGIKQLSQLKLLTKAEKALFMKYKDESPSFKSLGNFLNSDDNKKSKEKIKKLIVSTSIIAQIFQSNQSFQNKLLMLKFLETMRQAIFYGTDKKKWKNAYK